MAAVAVVVVVAAVLLSGFWGKKPGNVADLFAPQHLGNKPSTITIICRSSLTRVSGMALKPSLVRHSRNV